MKRENPILEKSYKFAIRIVRLYQYLNREKKEYHLSVQILKSGTSIGANAEEAIGGFSKNDFIAKLRISYKEAKETHYWIRLLRDTDYLSSKEAGSLLKDCEEILKIIVSILKSSKENG
ncbi:MAG TPA: four helix bundle protein [Candidatus Cloacimonetes bacterium]|nr:four helix bundle protein [Candidatus Cloacimonadota bacterium]